MMEVFRKHSIQFVSLGIVIFASGWLLGRNMDTRAEGSFQPIRSPEHYSFIQPLVGFDIAQKASFPELEELQEKVRQVIEEEKVHGLEDASVYVRITDNGHWFGIHEDERFAPASLLKVPIMMAYFKAAESAPDLLSHSLYYGDSATLAAEAGKPYALKPMLADGQTYSVEELLEAMIIKSDNHSKDLLVEHIGETYLTELFREVGVPLPEEDVYGISARIYANFFRRLHNSTFLTREYSEKALSILARAEFKEGLRAGVPEHVAIAHKYGEAGVYGENGALTAVELHDCGIVYAPRRYIACIMTRGASIPRLSHTISSLSKTLYEGIAELP
jgi:beta-lactamase class A